MLAPLAKIAASIALLLLGTTASYGQAPAGNLAAFHMGIVRVTCGACHVEGDPKSVSPEVALASANGQCVACHGDSAKLAIAVKSKLANRNINPHASHLVAVDCTACHAGHARR